MKATKHLRRLLGISQEELAGYLSITRSQLTMYENGNRDLPTAVLVKLAEIEIFCNEPKAKKRNLHPQVAKQAGRAQALLEAHAKEQEYKLLTAERNLNATKAVYAQKLLLLHLVEHLKYGANAPITDSWLNMMEVKALDGIKDFGAYVQAKQQVQISGLREQYKQTLLLKESMVSQTNQ